MSVLGLNLFGSFRASLDGEPLDSLRSTKVQALLIYLAAERSTAHRREYLFTLLWPGMPEKSARHNLSQTLYALRQIIPAISSNRSQESVPLILANRQTVQMNPTAVVDVDIHQLDRLLEKYRGHNHQNLATCETCYNALKKVVDLYQGEFLADFYLEDSNPFEDWAEAVREKCRNELLDALQTLTDIYNNNHDYENAQKYIKRQLEIDDLRENSHRQKMEILALSGCRVEALRHYREYAQILENELGIPPSKEIKYIYERIHREEFAETQIETLDGIKEHEPPRNNLTPQLTPFIGRQEELAKLDAMLGDPAIRLVTIIGPGGIGKTRLAIACAERQLMPIWGDKSKFPFPDGVFFVPLADIEDPGQIPREIAKALNLSVNPGGMIQADEDTVEKQVMDYLQCKHNLLVLDNFEQLLDGVDFLPDILQTALDLQLLVTSRERLHLHGEQIFPIGGLEFPFLEVPENPSDYTAMQLFLESARRVRPDFEINNDDLVPLTSICRLVGGMPLGLELAASWVDMLSIEEVADEIQKGINILESGSRDMPTRHRSLRAVCDSTWERLDNAEQDIFARLSVFRGGFTREAAKEITGASLRTLAALQNKSLLGYDPTKKRYRIHPYLRRYGVEQLVTTPDKEFATHVRHYTYYCDFLESYLKKCQSGDTLNATDQMDREFANITAAWEWNIDYEHLLRFDQITEGFASYYDWNVRYHDNMMLCQEANEEFKEMESRIKLGDDSIVDPSILDFAHAKIQFFLGVFGLDYDKDQSIQLFKQSDEKFNKLAKAGYDIRAEKARLLHYQAITCENYEKTKLLLFESIALSREINDDWGTIESLGFIGNRALSEGYPDEAISWYERALSMAEDNNDSLHEIISLVFLGIAHRNRGTSHRNSDHYFRRAILKARATNNDRLQVMALRFYAAFQTGVGNLEDAKDSYEQAIKISEKLGAGLKYWSLRLLMDTQWLAGQFEEAEKSLSAVIDHQMVIQSSVDASLLALFSQFMALTGRYQEALKDFNTNNMLSKDFGSNFNVNCIRSRVQCWIALVQGQYEQAKSHSLYRMEIARSYPYLTGWIAESQADIARAEYGLGNSVEAKRILIEALATTIELMGYYQLVFTLPITLLFLSDEDSPLTLEVYQQVMRDPFLGRAQLYKDLVYQHLPDEITSIPVETVETSPEHREALWAAARKVLATWTGGNSIE